MQEDIKTQTPIGDMLRTQMNAEGRPTSKPSSSNLIINEPIDGTPLRLVGITDTSQDTLRIKHGYFIALGNNRVSEIYNTQQEALDLVEMKTMETWNLIANIIVTMIETGKKIDIATEKTKIDENYVANILQEEIGKEQ